MPVLIAAVVVVGALCAVDLLLTFGVIRRLREHSAHLERLLREGPPDLPRVGDSVGAFTATTLDGESVSQDLADGTLVAFFSTTCAACHEQLPAFVAHAGERPRDRVLAVVVSDGGAELRPHARTVTEGSGGPVVSAFGISAFPTYCVVEDGRLSAVEVDAARLAALPVA